MYGGEVSATLIKMVLMVAFSSFLNFNPAEIISNCYMQFTRDCYSTTH